MPGSSAAAAACPGSNSSGRASPGVLGGTGTRLMKSPLNPEREIARMTLGAIAEARSMAAAAGLEPKALQIDPADEARIQAVAKGSPVDELFFETNLQVDLAMRRTMRVLLIQTT